MNRLHNTRFFLILVLALSVCICYAPVTAASEPIIIDHTSTRLSEVPLSAIQDAKSTLHIAYGHTSHGSQITDGMTGLVSFANAPYGGSTYRWNDGGSGGALDLADGIPGASDLGNPDYTTWASATREYLNAHPDVNVIMWSWCGQADTSAANINTYLTLMNQLESEYPDVKFVYMTGHLVGSGENGNLNQRNEQIRAYVRAHNKILFDFADIESYDPDGLVNYMKLYADDGCNYDGGNWATAWQDSHTLGVDWYNCGAAHTQPLNANMKAYAAWHLWARLAGWDGSVIPTPTPTPTPTVTTPPADAPVADFSADPVSGSAPLSVQFTDLSTGDGISAWAWDFDSDGVVDSTGQSPEFTYTSANTYTVTLVVTGTGGTGREVKTDYITVTDLPTPTPTVTVEPTPPPAHTVPVVTAEVVGSTIVMHWQQIDDDDLLGYKVVASIKNPHPAYPGDGYIFWITERTTTTATLDSSNLVPGQTYYLSVTALYDPYDPVAGNAVRLTFPDIVSPTPTTVPAPVAGFSGSPVSGDAPLTVRFTDESTGLVSDYAWDFNGDLNPDSFEKNPEYTYTKPGIYPVGLGVSGPGGMDTELKTDYITVTAPSVPAPVAQFSADPLSGTAPLNVTFTDASSPADSYAWDFENDGIIDSTEQNPWHIYLAAGSYTVNLTVTNASDSASEVKPSYITVSPDVPAADFSANMTSGAAPLAVLFKDESAGDGITAWAWDFENDGTVDSTGQNPEHVYALPGVYNVSLIVTGAGGSDTMIREQFITALTTALVANFTANQTTGYAPLTVEFTDISSGTVLSRSWDFENDGVPDSSDPAAVHTYANPGNYTVNLTVSNDGGSNSSVMKEFIIVRPAPAPVVEFSANLTTGYAPLAVQFTDDSKGQGLITWSWDFENDGVTDSTDQNPVHIYPAPGNYSVSLSVKGTGGITTSVRKDYIVVSAVAPKSPRAEFIGTPTHGKAPLTVKFTDKSIGRDITAWAWDFNGDGITDSTEQNPGYTYTAKGSYPVTLTVKNAGGSGTKTRKDYIRVSGLEKPEADFRSDKQSGNAPLTVKFTDKSKGDAITEWSWDFNNDGTIDSTEKNPAYTYPAAGKYSVKLVVTNAAGTDTEVRSDFITVREPSTSPDKKPVAVISADKTWGAPPMTVRFADMSKNNPTSRTWYFGDGTSSTEQNPVHPYGEPGIYFARLYVENSAGTDQDYRFIFVLPRWLAMTSFR